MKIRMSIDVELPDGVGSYDEAVAFMLYNFGWQCYMEENPFDACGAEYRIVDIYDDELQS